MTHLALGLNGRCRSRENAILGVQPTVDVPLLSHHLADYITAGLVCVMAGIGKPQMLRIWASNCEMLQASIV